MATDAQGNPLFFNSSATVTVQEPSRELLVEKIQALDTRLEQQILRNHGNFPRLTSCDDLSIKNGSAVVTLDPLDNLGKVDVVCEFNEEGKSWTVLQNRFDGSVDFYRSFQDYENGFGNMTGEFWMGLQTLRRLVQTGYFDLEIDMVSNAGEHYNRTYSNFTIGPGPGYALSVSGYDDKNRGLSYNSGRDFTAYDNNTGCARDYHGGFWYSGCTQVNLNGRWGVPGQESISWSEIHSFDNFWMTETTMKFRPSQ
ncbi:ficolin-1-like [Aplysia californica]|uniref:Ficolin-1-like n=1 Tax=Aplysia californica TaxID=6500 RepID=A0ABM0K2X1_APLCA|nr:ficolin-1-like [Aplysia californica]